MAYDISDAARLRAVHKTVKAHGESLQYSVFLCDLDAMELTQLKWRVGELIHHGEDSVLFLDLGNPSDLSSFDFLGLRPGLPVSGARIL